MCKDSGLPPPINEECTSAREKHLSALREYSPALQHLHQQKLTWAEILTRIKDLEARLKSLEAQP